MILAYGKKFGESWWRRKRRISLKGALNQHVLTFGQPGSGKSSFLFFQLLQDIKSQKPFILFDTHSDLFHQALSALVSHRYHPESVIVINPDPRFAWLGYPGINLLEVRKGQEVATVVGTALYAFRELWRDSWGHRMEDVLRQSMNTLTEAGLTIRELGEFWMNEEFRNAVVQGLEESETKTYWTKHIAEMRTPEVHYILESSRNKIAAFLSNNALKHIFSQETSSIDFADAMQQGKVILINLNKTYLQESTGLFGALLWVRLYLDILSFSNLKPEERKYVTIYADECPEYYCEPILQIAAGARKFGISLRLFTQLPSQFKDHLDTLIGNCGTIVSFAQDRKGAERLAKELWVFSNNHIKYQPENPYALPSHYSIAEQLEHAITELTTQKVGECYIRTKGPKDDGNPWIANVPKVNHKPLDPELYPDGAEPFLEQSAKLYNCSQEQIDQDRQARLERFQQKPPPKITNRS